MGKSQEHLPKLASAQSGVRLRAKPAGKFCWQDNEAYDVFQPIIGPFGMSLYGTLSRMLREGKVTYSLTRLASITAQSRATIDRNLKVLEYVGMVRLRVTGGNRESICELFDLKDLIQSWGTVPQREATVKRLKLEVKELRKSLAGKPDAANDDVRHERRFSSDKAISALFLPLCGRDTSVSPEIRPQLTGETKAGDYLLIQNTTHEKDPSPTPSQEGVMKNSTDFSSPKKPHLKWAQDRLNGVIDDLRNHLLDTNKPSLPNLAHGFAEWDKFGFGDFAVEEARSRSDVFELILSAPDPVAAQRGIEKYRRKWEASTRNWFNCEVRVTFARAA